MIEDLKPYSEYRDSGVPWLGKLPNGWQVRPLKRVVKFNPSKSEANEALRLSPNVTYLPMERVGTDGRIAICEPSRLSTLSNNLTHFRRNDVILAKITPCFENGKGACLDTLPTEFGFGSTEFIVLRSMGELFPQFLYRVMTLPEFRKLGTDAMTGAAGQQRVPLSFVRNFPAPIPSRQEQEDIIRFLNHTDARMQKYIRTKQKLIKLLEEQKQAIIHRAITRGLDPSVGVKSSGLTWLGEMPAHWDALPAKCCYREVDERSTTGGEELLSVSHITGVTPRSQKNITMFMAESYVGHKLCRPGDLVVNTMWAWMAALGVSPVTGIVSPSYAVYRPLPSSQLSPRFADLLLRTAPYISEYICRSTGIRSSRLRLYPEQFLRIKIICPPLNEQQAIVRHILETTEELRGAISSACREIDLVKEYRVRLTADVITGKLDVRDASKELSEEIDEAESVTESDDAIEGDEDSDANVEEAAEEAEA